MNKEKKNRFKLKHNLYSTVLIIFVVLAIVLVNVFVTVLAKKYPLQMDMTETSYNSLSEDNIALIKSFKNDIKITVLYERDGFLSSEFLAENSIADDSDGGYSVQATQFLDEYQKYNPNITVDYVDSQSPDFSGFLQEYPSEDISAGDILIECNDSLQVLKPIDLFNLEQQEYYYTINGSNMESAITSAIIKVSGNGPIYAANMTGHNCKPSDTIISLLQNNNFSVSEISTLDFDKLDENISLLIINSPTTDFSDAEISALEEYLGKEGKMLFYISDVSQPKLEKLEAFLAKWGIVSMNGVICETDSNRYYSDYYLTYFDYAVDSYQNLTAKGINCITYSHRPYELTEGIEGIKVTPLLSVPSSALLYPIDRNAQKNFDSANAQAGPFYGSLLSEKELADGTSAIFAVGSSNFFIDQVMESNYGNADFVMLTIKSAIDTGDSDVYFAEKAIKTTSVLIDSQTSNLLGTWLFMVLVPLIILTAGFYIWIRRSVV